MKQYFALGSYTEPILFGTGEVFHGKGKGITICTFENGRIESAVELEVRNPSFLCIDEEKRKIYAVNEMKEYQGKTGGGMTQLSYDENCNMKIEGSWNTQGTDPCHIAVSPNGRFVAVANFAGGSVTVYPVDERGNACGEYQFFQHEGSSVHPVRQRGPHAHSCIFAPDENLMYVPDLGMDKVAAYRYDGEKVSSCSEAEVDVAAGSGPRYGEFGRDGNHFYLIDEISSQVMHFAYQHGHMELKDIVDTLPEDFSGDNICSDLHITPDGRFLYASNRGHDSLVCYRIEPDGALSFVERQPCGGKTPRNFAIDPTGHYILTGNQDSDNITVFEIGTEGQLTQVSVFETGSPVCIRFFRP